LDKRQIGPGNAERPNDLAGEILDQDRHAADFDIEFAVVERDVGALISAISRSSTGIPVADFSVDGFNSTRSRKRSSWSWRSEARIILPSAVR